VSDQFLSQRIRGIQPSSTMAISARAQALQRAGRDVVSLSVGEPDFPVFPHVAEAIEAALRAGKTKYTPSPGLPELREAISASLQSQLGLTYAPADIIATAGAKQALYNACQALLDEGDECIIPNPYWVSYPEMARLAGARVVELALRQEDGWVPRAEDLAAVITERTRVVMLGSPSNPTGAVWNEGALRGLAEVLRKHPRADVLSDDIYDRLTYGGVRAANIALLAPDLAERTVLVNGCSKAYAMTGLRLGWAAGPRAIIAAMCKVQDASTSNPSSLSQAAAIAALRGPQEHVEEMRRAFERRRDLMVELLRAIPGLRCEKPDGAYYVFADISGLFGKRYQGTPVTTSHRIAELLLEEHGVAVVPGSAFGREGFIRLSFANSEANLRKALERMAGAFAALG
jgi:aspartate aminotransferase